MKVKLCFNVYVKLYVLIIKQHLYRDWYNNLFDDDILSAIFGMNWTISHWQHRIIQRPWHTYGFCGDTPHEYPWIIIGILDITNITCWMILPRLNVAICVHATNFSLIHFYSMNESFLKMGTFLATNIWPQLNGCVIKPFK